MNLDFSPITSSPEYLKLKKFVDQTGKSKAKFIWLLMIIPIFWIPLLIYVLLQLPKAPKDHKAIQAVLSKFARQNSFTYHEIPWKQEEGKNLPDVNYTLPFKAKQRFNGGHMEGTYHGLTFDYINGGIELIDYSGFSAQPGNQETRQLTALLLTLPISLPKLFIDTKRNNVFGFEVKANNIEGLQEYKLEGDFPEFYRVFAQKDDQINVLSILTPEVMQKLLEHKHYDVWIDGNKLVVFSGGFDYLAGIPIIFPTAEMLLNEIDKIARELRQQ